jgi:hypothetical protein
LGDYEGQLDDEMREAAGNAADAWAAYAPSNNPTGKP